ncbi:MAG: T9SS type A sorting domain-containing protein [Ignavibacteriae bacterium]|nr:T9SS type A sorting domain-containing protein [Ignavibacteriota bacterium]
MPPVYFTPNPQQMLFFPNQPGQSEEGGEEPAPCDEEIEQIALADAQTLGGLSLVYTSKCGDDVYMFWHSGDPAPAPPQFVQVTATPPDPYGYRDAKVTWAPNKERDLDHYELWRRITGTCGNGVWYLLTSELDASTTEYIDPLSTVGYGNECTAYYKLKAIDLEEHASSYSDSVSIGFGSDMWKVGGEGNESKDNLPVIYALREAYPNPFNPTTQINFDLPEDANVSLVVYDVLGREIATLRVATARQGITQEHGMLVMLQAGSTLPGSQRVTSLAMYGTRRSTSSS